MKNVVVSIVSAVAVVGCAAGAGKSEFHGGENLIQPVPLPKESWAQEMFRGESNLMTVWKANDGEDQFHTVIFYGDGNRELNHHKSIDSGEGRKACSSFVEGESVSSLDSGVPSMTWVTECQMKNGKKAVVLHKTISGRDSFYVLKRIWYSAVPAGDVEFWKTYLAGVKLCDTRGAENPCPQGFQKVN